MRRDHGSGDCSPSFTIERFSAVRTRTDMHTKIKPRWPYRAIQGVFYLTRRFYITATPKKKKNKPSDPNNYEVKNPYALAKELGKRCQHLPAPEPVKLNSPRNAEASCCGSRYPEVHATIPLTLQGTGHTARFHGDPPFLSD